MCELTDCQLPCAYLRTSPATCGLLKGKPDHQVHATSPAHSLTSSHCLHLIFDIPYLFGNSSSSLQSCHPVCASSFCCLLRCQPNPPGDPGPRRSHSRRRRRRTTAASAGVLSANANISSATSCSFMRYIGRMNAVFARYASEPSRTCRSTSRPASTSSAPPLPPNRGNNGYPEHET